MRVLTSFSLLGGTAQCAHNIRELYATTVKPGRISQRRNLNSWKNEREETARERREQGERRGKEEQG